MSLFGKNDKKDDKKVKGKTPNATDAKAEAPDAKAAPNGGRKWFLPEDSRDYLANLFKEMKEPVVLEVYTRKGRNDAYNEAMTGFVGDLAVLGEMIIAEYHGVDSDKAHKRGVLASPTLLIQPEKYRIGYRGTPLGEEARTFIETILLASHGQSTLSKSSRDMLAALDEKREVMVFMNPDCPYCPGQVANAFKAAIERPDLVSAMAVETGENQEFAQEYKATSLPTTVINETFVRRGLQPEERFVMELVALREAEELLKEKGAPAEAEAPEAPKAEIKDAIIVGGGPGGLTAAIYAERSGLKTVVLEKSIVGGQVNLTPEVENYPGFKKVGGIQLMEMISGQAREYADVREGEEVLEIRVGRLIEVVTAKGRYQGKALVLAMGAHSRMLGVPGEDTYYGRGVSVCASCDGWAYKGKKVIMVGGGNTALTEALHLKNLGVDVTLVLRRDGFRAEKHLQESVERSEIPVVTNTVVEEFLGEDGLLTGARLRNTATGETTDMALDGAFVAIGWIPNSRIAQDIGVAVDEYGYVKTDRAMRTNIPRIYACGDITGGVQQIVTAVGEGSTAALSMFEDISNPYWKKTEG